MTASARLNAPAEHSGLFITFEGLDGVGKTTQLGYLERALAHGGRDVVRLREPGGTQLGEQVRHMLLHGKADVSPLAELLLFEAARAQLVHDVIRPALLSGAVVLCDRFYDSTMAYQGYGRKLGADTVLAANGIACNAVVPTVTLLFDLEPGEATRRATRGGADRMESEDVAFREEVRQGFLSIARNDPARVKLVDASGTPQEVWGRVCDCLSNYFDLPNTVSSDKER